MKVKQFAHRDSDGGGTVVVSKRFFDRVDYELCEYEDINERVIEFVKDLRSGVSPLYDMVAITDITVTRDVADLITKVSKEYPMVKFILIHHHKRVEWLNRYSWAVVESESLALDGTVAYKNSATNLWFKYLSHNYNTSFVKDAYKIAAFAELVRQWDTMEWAKTNYILAEDLNMLCNITGVDRFIERFTEDLNIAMTDSELFLISEERDRISRYVDTKKREIKKYRTGTGLICGVVYAENNPAIVASELIKLFPDIDFIAVISMASGRVSYRTLKSHVHVGNIAEAHGGGGWKNSAGGPVRGIFTGKLKLQLI